MPQVKDGRARAILMTGDTRLASTALQPLRLLRAHVPVCHGADGLALRAS